VKKLNLNERIKEIDDIIAKYMPAEEGYQKTLYSAMNYSIGAGGKRIRPMLLLETYRLFTDANEEICHHLMAAIEMIHTYSLIHDDLPSMDDDEYRRGRKTTHIVYGEAIAILAGDALLNLAYETASHMFRTDKKEIWDRGISALQMLNGYAGGGGMIGGQTADILAEKGELVPSLELLHFIHAKKTAALIQGAMTIGAILADTDYQDKRKINKAAYKIGMAFQFQDDILDVTGSFDELGKPIGSDDKKKKLTSVSFYGLDETKVLVERLTREAIEILDSFPRKNEFLKELVESLIYRRK